ncbi:hypothetical protein HK101_001078 [Irineochytrium annulatum]|nr:hypothetical protein HK101_001078 [Irineochytrium annulatum]
MPIPSVPQRRPPKIGVVKKPTPSPRPAPGADLREGADTDAWPADFEFFDLLLPATADAPKAPKATAVAEDQDEEANETPEGKVAEEEVDQKGSENDRAPVRDDQEANETPEEQAAEGEEGDGERHPWVGVPWHGGKADDEDGDGEEPAKEELAGAEAGDAASTKAPAKAELVEVGNATSKAVPLPSTTARISATATATVVAEEALAPITTATSTAEEAPTPTTMAISAADGALVPTTASNSTAAATAITTTAMPALEDAVSSSNATLTTENGTATTATSAAAETPSTTPPIKLQHGEALKIAEKAGENAPALPSTTHPVPGATLTSTATLVATSPASFASSPSEKSIGAPMNIAILSLLIIACVALVALLVTCARWRWELMRRDERRKWFSDVPTNDADGDCSPTEEGPGKFINGQGKRGRFSVDRHYKELEEEFDNYGFDVEELHAVEP